MCPSVLELVPKRELHYARVSQRVGVFSGKDNIGVYVVAVFPDPARDHHYLSPQGK